MLLLEIIIENGELMGIYDGLNELLSNEVSTDAGTDETLRLDRLHTRRDEKLARLGDNNQYENLTDGYTIMPSGTVESNANKIWNDMSDMDAQTMLSDAISKHSIYEEEGKTYQGYGEHKQEFFGEDKDTRRAYLFGTKGDSDAVKFGLARGDLPGAEYRYIPGKAEAEGYKVGKNGYGWDSGDDGVDINKKHLDVRLPYEIATALEGAMHGRKGALENRRNKDYLSNEALSKASGVSEYYNSLEGLLGDTSNTSKAEMEKPSRDVLAMYRDEPGAQNGWGTLDKRKTGSTLNNEDKFNADSMSESNPIDALQYGLVTSWGLAQEGFGESLKALAKADKGFLDREDKRLNDKFGENVSDFRYAINKSLSQAGEFLSKRGEFVNHNAAEYIGYDEKGGETAKAVWGELKQGNVLQALDNVTVEGALSLILESAPQMVALSNPVTTVAVYSGNVAQAKKEAEEIAGGEITTGRMSSILLGEAISIAVDKVVINRNYKGIGSIAEGVDEAYKIVDTAFDSIKKFVPTAVGKQAYKYATDKVGRVGKAILEEGTQEIFQDGQRIFTTQLGQQDIMTEENLDALGTSFVGGGIAGGGIRVGVEGIKSAKDVIDATPKSKMPAMKTKKATAETVTPDMNSEEVADVVTEDEKTFVKDAIKTMDVDIKDVDLQLDNIAQAEDILERLEKEGNSETIDLARKGLQNSKAAITKLAENVTDDDLPTFGSAANAEDMIRGAFEGADANTNRKKLTINLEKIANKNGVTKAKFAKLKKDFESVKEEATESRRGANSYFREAKRLFSSDNPDIKKIKKNVSNLKRLSDTTTIAVKAFGAALVTANQDIAGANSTGIAPKGTKIGEGRLRREVKYTSVNGIEAKAFIDIVKGKNGKWQVSQKSMDIIEDKRSRGLEAKQFVDELIALSKGNEGLDTKVFGTEGTMVDPGGLNKDQKKRFDKVKPTKVITNAGTSKTGTAGKIAKGNPSVAYSSSASADIAFTEDDVVLMDINSNDLTGSYKGKTLPSKEIQNTIVKALKAGATIAFANEKPSADVNAAINLLMSFKKGLEIESEAGDVKQTFRRKDLVEAGNAEVVEKKKAKANFEAKEKNSKKKFLDAYQNHKVLNTPKTEKALEVAIGFVTEYFPETEKSTSRERVLRHGNTQTDNAVKAYMETYNPTADYTADYASASEGLKELLDNAMATYDLQSADADQFMEEYKEALELATESAGHKADTRAKADLENANGITEKTIMTDIINNSPSNDVETQYVGTDAAGKEFKSKSKEGKKGKKFVGKITNLVSAIKKVVKVTSATTLNTVPYELLGSTVDRYMQETLKTYEEIYSGLESRVEPGEKVRANGEKYFTEGGEYTFINSPGRALLFDTEGTINENVALAMKLALDEMIAFNTKMLKDGFKSDDELKQMLGLDRINKGTRKLIGDKGMLKSTMTDMVSKSIAGHLGISGAKTGVDMNAFPRVITDLANMAIIGAAVEGKLTFDQSVTTVKYSEVVLGTENKAGQGFITFVKVSAEDVSDGFTRTNKVVDPLVEDFNDVVEHLPVTTTTRKGPSETKLSKKTIKKKASSIRKNKTANEVPKASQETMEALMGTEWKSVGRMVDRVAELATTDLDSLITRLGWVDVSIPEAIEDMTAAEVEVQDGKNRDIEKALNELLALSEDIKDKSTEDKKLYFEYFFSKNGRYFIDSNTLNPQTNTQLHRFIIQPAENEATYRVKKNGKDITVEATEWVTQPGDTRKGSVDVTKQMQYAIAQGIGFAVDKKETASIKEIANTLLMMAVNGDTESLAKLEEALIKDGEIKLEIDGIKHKYKVEHFAHMLQTLMFLKDVSESKESKATTFLTAEYDAVTSGFANKLLQIPILGETIEGTFEYLERVGLVRKGSLDKLLKAGLAPSMNDVLGRSDAKSLQDNYQKLASDVKVLSGAEVATNQKDAKKKLKLSKNAPAGKIWENLKDVLPQKDSDGGISSALRTLFKYPFMIFNYAGSIAAIRETLATDLTESTLKGILKSEKGDINEALAITMIHELDLTVKGKKITDLEGLKKAIRTTKPEDIKTGNSQFETLDDYLGHLIDMSYGVQMESILTKQFGPYIEAQEKVNESFKAMFAVYNVEYQAMFEAASQKNGYVSTQDHMDIVKALKSKFPGIKAPFSEGELDGIDIVSEASVLDGSGKVNTLINTDKVKKTGLTGKTSNASIKMKEFAAAVSAGSVIPTHYIDGSLIAATIGNVNGMGMTVIHDAIMPPLVYADKAVQGYNKGFFNVNKEYSIIQSIQDKLASVASEIEGNKAYDVVIKVYDKELGEDVSLKISDYFNRALEGITKLNIEVQARRTELFNTIESEGAVIMHAAGSPESVYEVGTTEEATTPDNGREMTVAERKSMASKVATKIATGEPLSADDNQFQANYGSDVEVVLKELAKVPPKTAKAASKGNDATIGNVINKIKICKQ